MMPSKLKSKLNVSKFGANILSFNQIQGISPMLSFVVLCVTPVHRLIYHLKISDTKDSSRFVKIYSAFKNRGWS